MTQNVTEAIRALTEKPFFATSVERFLILDELKSSFHDLPQPLRFSKMFTALLSRVSTPLEDYDLIAGRCVDRELTPSEEAQFQAFISHPDFPGNKIIYSSGHCTLSWEALVSKGLVGLREEACRSLVCAKNEDQRIFLSAAIEIYDAIAAYALRYARAAEEKGLSELAENLSKAALKKPDSFASALQLLWLVTFINCAYITPNPTLTVGRLDQILYPLYKADLESGSLTRKRAVEYVTDYYCKHNLIMGRGEHQVGDESNSTTFKRILNFDAPQYLLLAGVDKHGASAINELTEIFAECIVPSFKNPVVVVRYVNGMDQTHPALWRTLCDRALHSASMMFYNDQNVYSAFRRVGFPEEDARRYAHFGCNWCSPGDNGAWMSMSPRAKHFQTATPEEMKLLDPPYMRTNTEHGWPEDFLLVMRELADRDPESVTIEDFYTLFFDRMSNFIDRKLAKNALELQVRKRKPSTQLTFADCFLTDSIKNAECYTAGAKYHFQIQSFQMFGTVADCFITIDQLVMIEKKITLKQLLEATEANFEGHADILALCRNAEKYGMDTPLSNKHARRLAHTACDLMIEKSKPYLEKEGLFLIPCMQSDTWHLKLGEDFGATPNGRLAHTPFSQNTRPSNGACINGLSAMFNSMLNLPTDGLVSGALNLDIDPKQFKGENGKAYFASMLAAYFNAGGLHAQVTTANVEDLIDAQINPEPYRDLRVRVTGYSGVYVDICKRLQDDIIERMK